MGIDLAQNRIVFTGNSENLPVYLWYVHVIQNLVAERTLNSLSSRNYVAAGYVSIFVYSPSSSLIGRTIGLNELHPTGKEIAAAMEEYHGKPPHVAHDSIENMRVQAMKGDLAALVRKKMGDGTHGVGTDVWDVPEYPKTSIRELVVQGKLDEEQQYIQPSEDTTHYLDQHFSSN